MSDMLVVSSVALGLTGAGGGLAERKENGGRDVGWGRPDSDLQWVWPAFHDP